MGKEEFKNFVKKNPKLIKHVQDGSSSWQKFYEIYDIYGEDREAWKDYLEVAPVAATAGTVDLVSWLKGINLDSIQTGVNNLQRVLGMVSDLTTKDGKKEPEEYKPRPLYKHFED